VAAQQEKTMATSSNKKKATAKEHATRHASSERRGKAASSPARVPASQKQRSHGRFPGERPMTGEDRPADRPGEKIKGQSGGRRPQAQGNPGAKRRG
jgi:hypothetical protein